MKFSLLTLVFSVILLSCSRQSQGNDQSLRALYDSLDTEIANSSIYELRKEQHLNTLRRDYLGTSDPNLRLHLANMLIAEYDAYNADSALHYISENQHNSRINAIPGEFTRLQIKRADVYGHSGFFAEALAIMQQIPADSITDALREEYYSTYCSIFQYLSEYSSEHEIAMRYEQMRSVYTDSLRQVVDPGSFNHNIYVLVEQARNGATREAISGLTHLLSQYPSGSRQYSIAASTLAYIYKISGNDPKYKYYLILSAISDVRGAVKENMSFREAATVMFADGDIERANRYLKKSIADANFYSALMRNAQSAKLLPVIDEAYTQNQQQLTNRWRIMVWITGFLLLILIITVILILKQYRNVHQANARVEQANAELNQLADNLQTANTELAARNNELHEYNLTKEQYAGLFMEYCSSAISTLHHYQQKLRKLTAQGANREALLKQLESSEISDQLLKNFYVKFDEAILNIYPSFVDKFNALLKPGEQVTLKTGELLNTELRLFALIRLGINDNNKIAEFLRCSLTTVYTYRSKMRRRALDPDGFEDAVRKIG